MRRLSDDVGATDELIPADLIARWPQFLAGVAGKVPAEKLADVRSRLAASRSDQESAARSWCPITGAGSTTSPATLIKSALRNSLGDTAPIEEHFKKRLGNELARRLFEEVKADPDVRHSKPFADGSQQNDRAWQIEVRGKRLGLLRPRSAPRFLATGRLNSAAKAARLGEP